MDWVIDVWNRVLWLVAPLMPLYYVVLAYPGSQLWESTVSLSDEV